MCLTTSAESEQYSGIWEILKNSTILGTVNYPRRTTSAYEVLCSYNKPTPKFQVHMPPEAVTFFQCGDTGKKKIIPGNDGISFPGIIFFFPVSPHWKNVTASGGMCTWNFGVGLL